MFWFLLISFIIFLIHLPFILIITFLSVINKFKKNIEINYNISGFYKISNLEIKILDSNKTIILFFNGISFELIWFRIRIQIQKFHFIGNLNSIEDKELNELIQMVMTKIRTNGVSSSILENNQFFQTKKDKYKQKIDSLLNIYQKNDVEEKEFKEIEKLEELNKHQPNSTFKEKIITQLIIFFDIIIISSGIYFELSESKGSYLVHLGKLHIGALKGQNRVNFKIIY